MNVYKPGKRIFQDSDSHLPFRCYARLLYMDIEKNHKGNWLQTYTLFQILLSTPTGPDSETISSTGKKYEAKVVFLTIKCIQMCLLMFWIELDEAPISFGYINKEAWEIAKIPNFNGSEGGYSHQVPYQNLLKHFPKLHISPYHQTHPCLGA